MTKDASTVTKGINKLVAKSRGGMAPRSAAEKKRARDRENFRKKYKRFANADYSRPYTTKRR